MTVIDYVLLLLYILTSSQSVEIFRDAPIDGNAIYRSPVFYPLGGCICTVIDNGVTDAVLTNMSEPNIDGVFRTNLKDSDPIVVVQKKESCKSWSGLSTYLCDVLIISAKQDHLHHGDFKVLYGGTQEGNDDVETIVKYGPSNLSYQGGGEALIITASNPRITLELRTTKVGKSFRVCERNDNGWTQTSDFYMPQVAGFMGCSLGAEIGGFSQPFKVQVSYLGSFPFRSREVLITSSSTCVPPSNDTISIILYITGEPEQSESPTILVAPTSTSTPTGASIPTSVHTTIIPTTPFPSPIGGPREITSDVLLTSPGTMVTFPPSATSPRPKLDLIAGACAGVGSLILVMVVCFTFFYFRCRKKLPIDSTDHHIAQEIFTVAVEEDTWASSFCQSLDEKCGSVFRLQVSDHHLVLAKLKSSDVKMYFVRDRGKEENNSSFENLLSTAESQNCLHKITLIERDSPTPVSAQVPRALPMRVERISIPAEMSCENAVERVHQDIKFPHKLLYGLLKNMDGKIDEIKEKVYDIADQNAMEQLHSIQVCQD